MNTSPENTHDITEPSPPDKKPRPVAPRTASLPMLAAGALLGVVATALILPRFSKPSAPAPAPNAQQAPGEPKAGGSGAIELSEAAAKTAGIRVDTARLSIMGEGLTVPGTVELSPNRSAKITSPAPGKVTRLLVSLGDTVRMGQPLVTLDSFEAAQAHAVVRLAQSSVEQARAGVQTAQAEVEQARATVPQAEADVAQARTRQASAQTALTRQRELAKAGAFSQAPLQAAQSELTSAEAELQHAEAELSTRTAQLQRTERLFKEELVSRNDLEAAQLEQRQNKTTAARAQARVGIARQALQREQTVFKGGLLNAREVQTAEAEVNAALGEVQKARQGVVRAQQDVRRAQKGEQSSRTMLRGAEDALRAARGNLYALAGAGSANGTITVAAPIGGIVTERTMSVGEAVERTNSLLVIENLNTVTVNASVPEQQVARIRIGQSVEVTVAAYPKLQFPGTVQSIAGRVDEKTRALPVRCLVENRQSLLRPEMFAKVTLGVGSRVNVLAVPVPALEEDGADRFVYVEESSGKYKRRKVDVGQIANTIAEIIGGLKPGERVVTEGVFILKSERQKDTLKEE